MRGSQAIIRQNLQSDRARDGEVEGLGWTQLIQLLHSMTSDTVVKLWTLSVCLVCPPCPSLVHGMATV